MEEALLPIVLLRSTPSSSRHQHKSLFLSLNRHDDGSQCKERGQIVQKDPSQLRRVPKSISHGRSFFCQLTPPTRSLVVSNYGSIRSGTDGAVAVTDNQAFPVDSATSNNKCLVGLAMTAVLAFLLMVSGLSVTGGIGPVTIFPVDGSTGLDEDSSSKALFFDQAIVALYV